MRVERKERDVWLLTKNGHNRTDRFPWIVEAALKNREQQFRHRRRGCSARRGRRLRLQRPALAPARWRAAALCVRHSGARR
ncbi:hypothetical protein AB7008_36995 [Bradyrhizobium sp. 521_C7_N1_3]|uniref:hypothetical protein n=1 Tax=Bradyrhizobium TaxID=374 RepID=UPI0035DC25F8